jgi:hypothetical protein
MIKANYTQLIIEILSSDDFKNGLSPLVHESFRVPDI